MNRDRDLHRTDDPEALAHVVDRDGLTVGTARWVQRTSGRLTTAERRSLLRPLARAHLQNAVGRTRLVLGVHPGRHASVSRDRLVPPSTVLTRAAEQYARGILPVPLLNHSYRTYVFGRALGEIDGTDVDTELLYAAALLHDTGLVHPTGDADFTLTSSRLARVVAEEVGLSTAATDTLMTAITMHHTPGVTADAGPVAHLLSAGAAVDVVGSRSWDLPASVIADAVREHPRHAFKTVFTEAFRDEAARVPTGRAQLLLHDGAFGAAIRFAPFAE